jgi:hypothetical protein
MPDSVRTKIRKAIHYGLEQVTTGNGYEITFGDINELERSHEQEVNMPAVNVNFGTETYMNAQQGSNALGYLIKSLPVEFAVEVQDINDVREEEMRVIAALERYFLNNRCIPDSGGAYTVVGNTVFTGNRVQGMRANEPFGHVIMDMDILYHQNILDPTSVTANGVAPGFNASPPSTVTISRLNELRLAVVLGVQAINGSGAYNLAVKQVQDVAKSVEQITKYPAVNVLMQAEQYDDSTTPYYQDRVVRKQRVFTVDAYLHNVNDILEEQEQFIADMEYRFMNFPSIPDSAGRRTCTECMFLTNRIFGMKANEPQGRVSMELQTYYRQTLADPSEVEGP